MKILSVEKGCPITIFYVHIPLATVTSSTVTSSKLNVENSTKAHYVGETHSYRLLKIEIIKSKNFMKTMINHRKLCKTISVSMYNMALFGKKHTASTSLQTPQNAPKKFPFSATAPIIFGFSFINFLRKKNIYF